MYKTLVAASVAMACGRLDVGMLGDASGAGSAVVRRVQVIAPSFASAATLSITIDQTAGDFMVAALSWDQSPDTVTVSDTLGLTWSSLPLEGVPSICGGTTGNATGAQLWYAQVGTSGTNVVTATQTSGAQPLGMFLIEYAGVATANVVDVASGAVAASPSNAVSAPPLVTTGTDLIIALFNDTIGSGTMTGGNGYVVEALDPAFPNLLEDTTEPAGIYRPNAALPTGNNDACWVATAVAFHTR